MASAERVQAATLFDTGTPIPATFDQIFWNLGPSVQNLAGQITLTESYTLTEIEAYLVVYSGADLGLQIIADDGGAPGTSVLHSTSTTTTPSNYHWESFSGFDWTLDAGTYWIAMIAQAGLYAAMPGSAPQPLDLYGLQNASGTWTTSAYGFGFRVQGEEATVSNTPLPAALPLMATGLAGFGLIGWRRRRRVG